jgi:aspartate kinase
MIAVKFGGSAIADAERIKSIAVIINNIISKKPVVVLSAIGSTTDAIIQSGNNALNGKIDINDVRELHFRIADELGLSHDILESYFREINSLLMGISLIKELSNKTFDHLISFGERLSVRIFSAYLNNLGIKSKAYDSWDLGLLTDSNFNNADVLDESYISINRSLCYLESNYDHVPVITGFIGKNGSDEITTFGRGGSDLTVSVVGAALNVTEIQVWKDVRGILSCDPRLVENPITINSISFEEAAELAYFGAKVLHPRSLYPAMKRNIPVVVKNYLDPKYEGTSISNELPADGMLLRSITTKRKITLVDIVSTRMLGNYGFLSTVFGILKDLKISVDMVATSEVSISFTLDNGNPTEPLIQELQKISTVSLKKESAIISLIGNIKRSSEILSLAFTVMNESNLNVQMISQGASKVNISFIINDDDVETCIKKLHNKFFYGE